MAPILYSVCVRVWECVHVHVWSLFQRRLHAHLDAGVIAVWRSKDCRPSDVPEETLPRSPLLCAEGGCLLLTAPLSPLTMYCPLHIPARKKWLRPHLSCVYEWEALRDREWNLQESMKRPSPLPSLSLSCLEDFSFFMYCSLCVRERHYGAANNVGVAAAPPFPQFSLAF